MTTCGIWLTRANGRLNNGTIIERTVNNVLNPFTDANRPKNQGHYERRE
ncbi:MAG: hypothetical protein IKD19_03740 [Prevotella sp.]|nr:hypothetical protein [Prevotella sp.]